MDIKPELYEKLGAFYLGRKYDVEASQMADEVVLYDSRDLTTHAVCVGMTGSGKTGLCISLLEEAALDGIPAIIIDPKGDIANLLLTFPDLAPTDFRPWISEDAARREGITPDEFAAGQAELWKSGLASWGQDGERIRRLREAAEVTIYTPGSEAGIPISILRSFDAPPQAILDDGDSFRDRVSSTATSVLGLLGVESDPLTSREHILLANILERAWRAGRPMDLASLIHAIQKPDFDRVGVMELESFYPAKDRFELATRFNNLLASPEFSTWMSGAALDVDQLLYDQAGAPRVAIFSIAHLSERERMFFVSLLLNQVVGWMRTKSGTSSLRALLYIDELFGFMPPVANPPSKQPLLTLLKQARAYGVGLVLATQNPMDLDYKGLSNTGTWLIGRLQTERDKARILEGLEGIGETGMNRETLDRVLSNLDKRVFLLHNVHEGAPVTFYTRWAMSYLAGPLTRLQIKALMDGRRENAPASAATTPTRSAQAPPQVGLPQVHTDARSSTTPSLPPVLPPGVEQRFLPVQEAGGGVVSYHPFAYAEVRVHLVETRKGLSHDESLNLLAPIGADARVAWDEAEAVDHTRDALQTAPVDGATFASLPSGAGSKDAVSAWKVALDEELYLSRRIDVFEFEPLALYSEPDESERDFRIRISDAIREHRDGEVKDLREKYASKVERVEERVRKADQKIAREAEQAESAKMQGLVSVGSTILSAVLGRKLISRSTVGRATTAMRGMARGRAQAGDVDRALEDRETLDQELNDVLAEIERAVEEMKARLDPMHIELSTTTLKPRRTDIDIRFVGLVWAPSPR